MRIKEEKYYLTLNSRQLSQLIEYLTGARSGISLNIFERSTVFFYVSVDRPILPEYNIVKDF